MSGRRVQWTAVGRAMLVSAAVMFVLAGLFAAAIVPLDVSVRNVAAGAVALVGVLDLGLAFFFLRKEKADT